MVSSNCSKDFCISHLDNLRFCTLPVDLCCPFLQIGRFYAKKAQFILFLDKMVNTILSCEFFAGRRWRREMYGLTFFAATPLAAEAAAE